MLLDIKVKWIPTKTISNQLSHHFSKRSNYHIEEISDRYIQSHHVNKGDFPVMHVNIMSSPANLNMFYDRTYDFVTDKLNKNKAFVMKTGL